MTDASWERVWTTPNKFLYNGANELNSTTGHYETHFRPYDPAIGRFTAVDPLASSFTSATPYNYAFNDPVGLNDVTGAAPNLDNFNAMSAEKQELLGDGVSNGGWSHAYATNGIALGFSTASAASCTGNITTTWHRGIGFGQGFSVGSAIHDVRLAYQVDLLRRQRETQAVFSSVEIDFSTLADGVYSFFISGGSVTGFYATNNFYAEGNGKGDGLILTPSGLMAFGNFGSPLVKMTRYAYGQTSDRYDAAIHFFKDILYAQNGDGNGNGHTWSEYAMGAYSYSVSDLIDRGYWIGRTSKGQYRLYSRTFYGNQNTTRTGLLRKLNALGFAITVAVDSKNLAGNPNYAGQFWVNTSGGLLSLIGPPQVGLTILGVQNMDRYVEFTDWAVDQIYKSGWGYELEKGFKMMGDPRSYVPEFVPPEVLGPGF